MGAHDGAVDGHAGTGQAGHQHLGHHHGRSGQSRHLVSGLCRAARTDGQVADRQAADWRCRTRPSRRLFRLTFPEAILTGKEDFCGDGFCGKTLEQQFIHNTYPMEGHSKVKMFYRYGGSFMGTMSDTNKWVKMYQSPELEFVVMQDCWFGGESNFPDVILPACTGLERSDLGEWAACGGYTTNAHIGNNYRVIVREQKCLEPMGESKSDYEILTLLAERLGMKELFTEGNSEDDWARLFYESSDLAKTLSWEEFEKKGYHIIPCPGPEEYKSAPGLRWYAEGRADDTADTGNPKRGTDKDNELGTYTGKIEFASESLRQNMPDDEGAAHCVRTGFPPGRDTRPDRTTSIRCRSSLPHPRFSFHTHYDNHTTWLNEIPLHRVLKDGYYWWPARIHPDDAKARKVKTGDIVELYNDRASVLCIAEVTWRVAKGVIHSYGCTGRYDPLEPGKPGSTEKGGCVNMLTSSRMVSKHAPGCTPNSTLCELRKWEG